MRLCARDVLSCGEDPHRPGGGTPILRFGAEAHPQGERDLAFLFGGRLAAHEHHDGEHHTLKRTETRQGDEAGRAGTHGTGILAGRGFVPQLSRRAGRVFNYPRA
jgi:hypothetical protein